MYAVEAAGSAKDLAILVRVLKQKYLVGCLWGWLQGRLRLAAPDPRRAGAAEHARWYAIVFIGCLELTT